MRPSQVSVVLREAIRQRRNVFLRGQPGSAKTDIVHQSAHAERAEVMTIITSLRDPSDANGLYYRVNDPVLGDVVRCIPTYELARMVSADKPLVVFFDEWPNASPATQAAFCNLTLSRAQNGSKISDMVTFIGAGNRRADRVGAHAMSTALMNRFCLIDVDIDVSDWLTWAVTRNIPTDVLAWIKARPDWLTAFKADPEEQQPTPRSIARMGEYLATIDISLPDNVLQEVCAGFVGRACARDYVGASAIARAIPSMESVIAHPETAAVPVEAIAQHAVLNMLAKRVNYDQLDKVFTYARRFEPEFQRMFVTLLQAAQPALKESAACIRWESERAAQNP